MLGLGFRAARMVVAVRDLASLGVVGYVAMCPQSASVRSYRACC